MAAVALAFVVACGPPPAPAPPVEPVAAPACPPPADSWTSDRCTISADGVRLPQLTVQPDGAEPFQVDVENVSVDVVPGVSGDCVPVRVRGTLEFEATSAAVALHPQAAAEVEGGLVTVTESTRLTGLTGEGDLVSGDTLITYDLVLSRVRVPCTALTLDVPWRLLNFHPVVQPGAEVWVPRALPLELREGPGDGRAIEIRASAPLHLPFTRTEERNGYSAVEVSYDDGARIRGWVRSAELEQTSAPGYGGEPGGGESHCLAGHGGCSGGSIYCGPADVAQGTPVSAVAGAGRWAVVRDGHGAEIVLVTGAEWAELRSLPGIGDTDACGGLHHAFVPAASVTPLGTTGNPTPSP